MAASRDGRARSAPPRPCLGVGPPPSVVNQSAPTVVIDCPELSHARCVWPMSLYDCNVETHVNTDNTDQFSTFHQRPPGDWSSFRCWLRRAANVSTLTRGPVTTVRTAVSVLAETTTVRTAVSGLAETTTVRTAVSVLAETTTVRTAVSGLAETTTVRTAVSVLAETTAVRTAVSGLADTTTS
ncbi:hypothetical protein LSAT2_017647 [Lamellibrachia satsuma]|nr:hypothetical protein LSAT2_017647 [Lamellibrachia satsuma]